MSVRHISKLVPMLYTTDIPGTIDFYVKELGFICDAYEKDWGWASLSFEGVEIMLALPNQHIAFVKPEFTGSFYFQTPDVDLFWSQLKEKARVLYPLESFEYGMREFAILDNNGYALQFGTPVN